MALAITAARAEQVQGRVVGVVVDSVSDVLNLEAAAIKDPPTLSGGGESDFITGIASVGERMLMLVDIEALLGDAALGATEL